MIEIKKQQVLQTKKTAAENIIAKYYEKCNYTFNELKIILEREFFAKNDTCHNVGNYGFSKLKTDDEPFDIEDLTEGMLNYKNRIELFFIPLNNCDNKYLLLAIEMVNENIVNYFEYADYAYNLTISFIVEKFIYEKNV